MRGTGIDLEADLYATKLANKTSPVILCVIHHRQNPIESTSTTFVCMPVGTISHNRTFEELVFSKPYTRFLETLHPNGMLS
jgi:hypothetical protein